MEYVMAIYYVLTFSFIVGLTALLWFYFAKRWVVIREPESILPKSKKIIIISLKSLISAVLFISYFIILRLIRQSVLISNHATVVDDEAYFISLAVSFFVLLFTMIVLVLLHLGSTGLMKLWKTPQTTETKRATIRGITVVFALALLLSVMGNASYFKYDNDAIYYSSFFRFSETKTDYSEVEHARITYNLSDGNYSYTYELRLKNGKQFRFGLYTDNIKALNQNLITNDTPFHFEAEHCKTEYDKIFR